MKLTLKRDLPLLLAALLVLSLAACGKQGSDDTTKPDGEPKDAQEAAAMYKDLMDQENAILTENQSLWEKVFMSAWEMLRPWVTMVVPAAKSARASK